jgi:hypothetical protein
MLAVKKRFVGLQVYFALKKVNARRETIGYDKARTVGIIFSVGNMNKHDNIKKFVRLLENDGKKVDVLTFLGKEQDNHEFLFDYFREDDVSFWGHFKTGNINRFIEKEFDYLFHVDLETNPLIEHVLARSLAKCRIGAYKENKSDFYEMMVKTNGDSIGELINQLYYYTKSLI